MDSGGADDLFESTQNGQLDQVKKILQSNGQNINATNHVITQLHISNERTIFTTVSSS
jgi:hypothetical protein